MAQSFAEINVHLIFSTKDRHPFLPDPSERALLHQFLGGILRKLGCPAIIVGGVEDHVHVLCLLSRSRSAAEVVRELKRGSSLWLKGQREGLSDFAWQSGYGIFSVSHSLVDQVRDYIAHQEEHHRRTTFQDEFRQFLQRHTIAYDERYLWD
jgi:putative transposase